MHWPIVADSLRPATTTETSGWPSRGRTGGLGRIAEGFAIYTSHTMSVGSNRYRALPNAQGAAAVIDATHPFAEGISANAAAACAQTGTPLLSLVRPPWTAGAQDTWHDAASLADAARMLPSLGERAFLTTGRQGLAAFASLDRMWFLIRCVDPPSGPLPPAHELVLARGPYDAAAELDLMRRHRIVVLVTKNSGGELTEGKLAAARGLGLPVVMVSRPPLPDVPRCGSVEIGRAHV